MLFSYAAGRSCLYTREHVTWKIAIKRAQKQTLKGTSILVVETLNTRLGNRNSAEVLLAEVEKILELKRKKSLFYERHQVVQLEKLTKLKLQILP